MTDRAEISRRSLLAAGAGAAMAPLFSRSAIAQAVCSVSPSLTPIKARPERAVSLREVALALAAGKPARFEGLTRLDGYVLDTDNHDIILWGLAEPGRAELQVADFVVALRSALLNGVHDGTDYGKSPAISIDQNLDHYRVLDSFKTTNPDGRRGYLQSCRQSDWQPVRVDGMIRNSRTASLLVEADYRMKQTAQGLVKLPLRTPFIGDFEISAAEWRSALAAGRVAESYSEFVVRYWFTPGRFNQVASQDGKTCFLDYAQVVLKDEIQAAKSGEKIAPGKFNPHARAFTCAWTARMDEIYNAEPIWRDMHNMYRNFAVARMLADNKAFPGAQLDPQFLLERYNVPRVDVPVSMPGSGRLETEVKPYKGGKTTYTRGVCGGVDVGFNRRIETNPDARGETNGAGRDVVAARPARTTLAWAITPGQSLVQSAPAGSIKHGGGMLDDVDPGKRGVVVVPGR